MNDTINFEFWLTFGAQKKSGYNFLSASGVPRTTKGKPPTAKHERSMKMRVAIPISAFQVPELSASITLADGHAVMPEIDVEAAQSALSEAIGANVTLTLADPDADPST